MKTYLFDTINRYKRFSEKLDVQTAICNKSWWVFNDSGEKELYIFNEDGTLDVSFGGRVTEGKWRYVSANKSIIVSANSESFMLDPAFIDNAIFALKLNGTDQYVFMIDENNTASFAPSTYKELMGYFDEKRNKVLALEQNKIREQKERELEERKRIELEKVKIEKQELAKQQQRKKEMQEQKRLEQKAKLDLCEQQKWMREQLPRWVYKYRKMISVSDDDTYLFYVICMKPLLLGYLFFVCLFVFCFLGYS